MATNSDGLSLSISSSSEDASRSNIETTPQDTLFKNVKIPVPSIEAHCKAPINDNINMEAKPEHTIISMPDDATDTLLDSNTSNALQPADNASSDLQISESTSKIAIKFILKKTRGICGLIKFYFKPISAKQRKLTSFLSSLKSSVKNTLARSTPFNTNHFTNTLVSTLKGQRLPDCLRFLGFSLTPISKRKKSKNNETPPILPLHFKRRLSETFVNPEKKPGLEDMKNHQFVKPKTYQCNYCNTRFYHLPVYLKHIRRHVEQNAEVIRCESCSKAFSSVVNKNRHQLQCHKRAIL